MYVGFGVDLCAILIWFLSVVDTVFAEGFFFFLLLWLLGNDINGFPIITV